MQRKDSSKPAVLDTDNCFCSTYCGVPAGVDAMKTAEKVLNDMAEKGEMPREMGNRSDRA